MREWRGEGVEQEGGSGGMREGVEQEGGSRGVRE